MWDICSCKAHYKMHFNYGLSCDLILVSKEALRLIIHTHANEGGLKTFNIRGVIEKILTLQINVNNSYYSPPPLLCIMILNIGSLLYRKTFPFYFVLTPVVSID